MSLGTVIRQRREDLHLTQDRLALLAGISKPYLSNIETGKAKNPPSDGILTLLEKHLKFPPGQLLHLAHMARTPSDVRQQHELMQAELQKLRRVVKELLAKAPRKKLGGIDLDQLAAKFVDGGNIREISAGAVVPVINRVAAGYPAHFTDLDYPTSVADEYVRCPDIHDPNAFAARVVGDSMEPNYREGDIVVFSPARQAKSGDDCFVRFAGNAETTFKRFYQDDEQTIRLQPLNNKYAAETHSPADLTGLWPAVFRMERLHRD